MPRRVAKRRRAPALDKRERRALLLESAIRVFARRGIGGARYAEIAREAKVSVPAVFFYFPTRAQLVREVLKEVARFFADGAQRVHSSDRSAPEILMEDGLAFGDLVATHPDHARVLLEWSTAVRDKVLWPMFLKFLQQEFDRDEQTIRRWRRETGREEGNPDDDARVLNATGYIVAQMRFTHVPNARIERFLRTVIRDTLGEEPANINLNGSIEDRSPTAS